MTPGTGPRPAGDPSGDGPSPESRDASLEAASPSGYVNLGALILDEEPAPPATRMTEEDEHGEPDEDFAAALSRFRARLIRNLPSGDARTHVDMGTAYRTMGLGLEAIGEFQQAIREDPANPAAYEMLGRCFLDAGQPDLAVSALAKALRLPREGGDEFLGIYYYMGRAQEASGSPRAAYDFYRKALAIDIDFRDVGVRFRDLGEALRTPPPEPEERDPSASSDQGPPPSGRGS